MRTYTAESFVNTDENISVQKIINKSGVTEPIHKHEFIELVYIASGSGTQCVDGREYAVSKGNMLFINYNQSHSFSSENELIYINLQTYARIYGRILRYNGRKRTENRVFRDSF